jgi:hypothetical protein
MFCGLDGGLTERDLYLLKRPVREFGETAGASVRCKPDAYAIAVIDENQEDRLRCHRLLCHRLRRMPRPLCRA